MMSYAKLSQDEKNALVKKATDAAYNYENSYGSCAQSCLGGLRDAFPELGISEEMFKSSYGLAGGCGCSLKGTCGALSGAAMAVSLIAGRASSEMDVDHTPCYDLIKKVVAAFEAKFGVTCCEVQTSMMGGCFDFMTEEGAALYNEKDGDACCARAVAYATELVANLIVNGEL